MIVDMLKANNEPQKIIMLVKAVCSLWNKALKFSHKVVKYGHVTLMN